MTNDQKYIEVNQPIRYLSKSECRLIIGTFVGYVQTGKGQLGAKIQVVGEKDRIVPVARLLKPESSTSHPDGSPVLFSIKIPPSSRSGEPYRIAILKRVWFPIGMDESDLSNLCVTVDVANFSTSLTGQLNDSLVEENFSMPVILRLNTR